MSDVRRLNCVEAISAVHDGYPDPDAEDSRLIVHTFLGTLGADWDRDEVIREIHKHPQSLFAMTPGTFAWGMGHRLAISHYSKRGTPLFIETRAGAFEVTA